MIQSKSEARPDWIAEENLNELKQHWKEKRNKIYFHLKLYYNNVRTSQGLNDVLKGESLELTEIVISFYH